MAGVPNRIALSKDAKAHPSANRGSRKRQLLDGHLGKLTSLDAAELRGRHTHGWRCGPEAQTSGESGVADLPTRLIAISPSLPSFVEAPGLTCHSAEHGRRRFASSYLARVRLARRAS